MGEKQCKKNVYKNNELVHDFESPTGKQQCSFSFLPHQNFSLSLNITIMMEKITTAKM